MPKKTNVIKREKLKLYRSRAVLVNDLLRVIASRGRKFFSEMSDRKPIDVIGRISCIEIDELGQIFMVQSWDGSRVLLRGRWGLWRHFNGGGTLASLVEDLVKFIRTGEHIPGHLGPWPSWLQDKRSDCNNSWGYPNEDMEEIRSAAVRLGIYPQPQKEKNDEEIKAGSVA